jgi:hypothetical protein
MKKRSVVAPVGVATALVALWVAQCSGPNPHLVESSVDPPEPNGGPYRVHAVVRNDGPGHGEVQITFRLRDTTGETGAVYQEDKTVVLERGEVARVVAMFPAPAGSYEPEIEVEYPPR